MAIFDEQEMIKKAGGDKQKRFTVDLKKQLHSGKLKAEPLMPKDIEVPVSLKKEKRKMKKKRNKKPKVKRSIAEILPISDITDSGMFKLQNDEGYLDIWQFVSKNVYAMNEQETRFSIYNLAHMFQGYSHAIKVVALNFPVSTFRQQAFIQKKIQACTNDLYRTLLEQKLRELEYLEFKRTNREYLIFIFGQTEFIVKERTESIQRYLHQSSPIFSLSEDKKVDILYKLNNQNSKLGTRY
ncbi:hypothetical protein [Bacillus sp. JJ722]|uniref:hypothetical protein n=1 Tax=Bacillus sp. JJ722 TaxID=3122973 RepID=UPI002FFF8042